jgi:hypothetical protein
MSHFNLAVESEEGSPPNRQLHSACWLHRPEDALIATAGADTKIHILSLANSEELCILSGHTSMYQECIHKLHAPIVRC